MARKSLLTESEIRRFMKLASMRPIGDDKLDKLHEQPEEEDMGVEDVEEFEKPTDSIPDKKISVSIEHLRKKMTDNKEN